MPRSPITTAPTASPKTLHSPSLSDRLKVAWQGFTSGTYPLPAAPARPDYTVRVAGDLAWRNALKIQHSRWYDENGQKDHPDHAKVRLKGQPPYARVEPRFRLKPDDRFFCIGSCFARNIEEWLIYNGITVLSKRLAFPKAEGVWRPNGAVNKFTTHSMANEILWTTGARPLSPDLLYEAEDGVIDLQLCPGVRAVPAERAWERRRYLSEDYFARLKHANVVVITLGLVEAWYDCQTDTYLNATPSYWTVRKQPGRFELRLLDFNENVDVLLDMIARVDAFGVPKKFIVTVSPVPLTMSFSGQDIILANTYSKSVLRAAAEVCRQTFANVDYFPSYENVTLVPRNQAYEDDCLHVTDALVRDNILDFLRLYMPDKPVTTTDFNEMAYLIANPDVDELVRAGTLESGFEHWTTQGQAEGRSLAI